MLVGEMPSCVRDDVMVGDGREVARLSLGGTGVGPPPLTVDVRVVVGEKFKALAACAAVTLGRDDFDMDVTLVTMDEAHDKVGDGGATGYAAFGGCTTDEDDRKSCGNTNELGGSCGSMATTTTGGSSAMVRAAGRDGDRGRDTGRGAKKGTSWSTDAT